MNLSDALVRRLRVDNALSDKDVTALEALPIVEKVCGPSISIVREGGRPTQCCLLIEGFLIRAKFTSGGKRQILSVHLPGDVPDLQSLHLHVMDHDLLTLSRARIGLINHDDLHALTRQNPSLAAALWRETLIDAAHFREWIFNIGRKPAKARLVHFLLEQYRRLSAIGVIAGQEFQLPMTQVDLADAIGLTPVHINRVLQGLRADGLLDVRNYTVQLRNLQALIRLAEFDDLYLHQSAAT